MQRDLIVKSRTLGGSTDLVLAAPIKPGFVDSLDAVTYKTRVKMLLDTLHALRRTSHEYAAARLLSDSIERVGVIQSVRVAVLEPEDKVLLVVTFDGNWQSYVRVLYDKVGTLLDLIFCSTHEYVTSHNHTFDEWAAWARRVQVESSFFYGSSGATARDTLYYRRIERMSLRGLGNPLNEARAVLPSAQGALRESVGKQNPRPDQPPLDLTGPEQDTHVSLETFNAGFAALATLYRFADFFRPPHEDSTTLRLATIDLLREFVLVCRDTQMNEVKATQKKRFERQLDWLFPGSDPATRFDVLRMRDVPVHPEINAAVKADIQGGILNPYSDITHGLTVLIAFSDARAAQFFLNSPSLQVTRAQDDHCAESGRIFQNLAFTPNGLLACGLSQDQLEAFPEDFLQGMAERCGTLGDVRNNHPRRWRLPCAFVAADKEPNKERQIEIGTVHAILHLRTGTDSQDALQTTDYWEPNHPLQSKLAEFASMKQHGVNVLAVESMRRRYRKVGETKVIVEHFGYADGGGQPNLVTNTRSQPRSHLGEIVCGYSNAADEISDPAAQTQNSWLRNGSFLVLRKYGQDVRKFNATIDAAVSDLIPTLSGQKYRDDAREMVLGKLMGRMQDGRPMVKPSGTAVTNDFNYSGDPLGSKCPLHAHVRLANPRTASPSAKRVEQSGDSLSRPPVIMRRSMSYGPESADDDKERGLMFMAYNASLSEQFEVIQRWLTQGNSTGSSSLQSCPIVGVPENHYPRQFRFEHNLGIQAEQVAHAQLEPPTYMFTQPAAYTWLEWGIYLFAPSITALDVLKSTAPSIVNKSEDKKAKKCPMAAPWSVEDGRKKLKQLKTIEATLGKKAALDAWKAAVEDPQAIRRLESASLWAAIREDHGGLLRTPYGVIVANRELIQQVFKDNENFSVCGHRERMLLSFGDIFIGKDAGPQYTDEAGTIPDELSKLPHDEVFETSKQAAEAKLNEIIQTAKEAASDNGLSEFETGFDARELLDEVLAELTEYWFGIQHGEYFTRSGSDPNWQEGDAPNFNKPLYPGHFAAPSRYMFQPNPGDTPTHLGQMHGRALKRAMTSFADQYHGKGTFPAGKEDQPCAPIAKAVLEDAAKSGKGLDFVASTMVGIIMGYTPTIYGAVLNVLSEWAKNDTLFEKRAAWNDLGDMSYDQAKTEMLDAFSDATKMQPMPQITWRTARNPMTLGESPNAIQIAPGRKIVLALVSGTQESLIEGVDDGRIMFGGVREVTPHPTHACPGYHQGIAAALGCLAALVCLKEKLRPGMTPHSFGIRGASGFTQSQPTRLARRSKFSEMKANFERLNWLRKLLLLKGKPAKGTVICWGDSWVSYEAAFPGLKDIQSGLSALGYQTPEDFCNDKSWYLLSNMAKMGNITSFLEFLDTLDFEDGDCPRAIFLSGGGNDSVGTKLFESPYRPNGNYLLNRKADGVEVINQDNLDAHLEKILEGYVSIINACDASLTERKWKTPIIVHGYAYPLPRDGGFKMWIQNPFQYAEYVDSKNPNKYDKAVATGAMRDLIEQLNVKVFSELRNRFPNRVVYVDLREVAPEEKHWGNDMHLTGAKFAEVAGKVHEAITEFWARKTP